MALPAYEIALIVLACIAGLLAIIVITVLIILCCLRWRRIAKHISKKDGETQTMERRWRFSLASLRGRSGSRAEDRRNRSNVAGVDRQPSFGSLPPLNEDQPPSQPESQRRRDPPPYNYPHRTTPPNRRDIYNTENITETIETEEIFTTESYRQSSASSPRSRKPISEAFQTSPVAEIDESETIVLDDLHSGSPGYYGDRSALPEQTERAYPVRVIPLESEYAAGSAVAIEGDGLGFAGSSQPYLVQDVDGKDDRYFVRLSMSVDELGQEVTHLSSGKLTDV